MIETKTIDAKRARGPDKSGFPFHYNKQGSGVKGQRSVYRTFVQNVHSDPEKLREPVISGMHLSISSHRRLNERYNADTFTCRSNVIKKVMCNVSLVPIRKLRSVRVSKSCSKRLVRIPDCYTTKDTKILEDEPLLI